MRMDFLIGVPMFMGARSCTVKQRYPASRSSCNVADAYLIHASLSQLAFLYLRASEMQGLKPRILTLMLTCKQRCPVS